MSDRKLVNLDFLNREAQLYKQAKNEVKTSGDEIQQAIEQNTKPSRSCMAARPRRDCHATRHPARTNQPPNCRNIASNHNPPPRM